MDPAELRMSVARDGTETVIRVAGELDMSTTSQLADTVNRELREFPGRIVLDLAGLTFCDSLGLGTLIVLSRAAQTQQTFLALRDPSPFFARMLDITGMRDGLNIAAP
jgi:anti-sigma B factor antagonist